MSGARPTSLRDLNLGQQGNDTNEAGTPPNLAIMLATLARPTNLAWEWTHSSSR
jgi:hypothetical protein